MSATEQEEIVRWRYEELRRAGYASEHAEVLSRQHTVDLHLAVDLLCRGCPPATAVRILL
jgi:hypothetical protein